MLVIIIGGMAFLKKSRKPPVPPTKPEVMSFLSAFNNAIGYAVVDNPVLEEAFNNVPTFFEKADNDVAMTHFIALLGGIRDPLGGRPLTQLKLVVDKAKLKNAGDGSVRHMACTPPSVQSRRITHADGTSPAMMLGERRMPEPMLLPSATATPKLTPRIFSNWPRPPPVRFSAMLIAGATARS